MSFLLKPVKYNCLRNPRPSLKRERGVVLIVALFIMALVATMAYTMMARLEKDTRRTTLLLRDTQAEFYAQGSIAWALDQLRNNLEQQKQNQLIDVMPIQSPTQTVNGYAIVSTIHDMQARFNINNVINTDSHPDFKKLLRLVDPKLTEEKAQALLIAVFDWIKLSQQQNEYTQYYFQLIEPYRPAHRPMQSISELQLVKGMTPALYQALEPYVTALPGATLINVQTAEAPVLALLSPTLTLPAAKALQQMRERTPFVTREALLGTDIAKNHQVTDTKKITVVSSYFLIKTEVSIEKQHAVLYTLVERSTDQNKVAMTILWQSKGVW